LISRAVLVKSLAGRFVFGGRFALPYRFRAPIYGGMIAASTFGASQSALGMNSDVRRRW